MIKVSLRLAVLVGLLAACSSPAAVASPTPTSAVATRTPAPSASPSASPLPAGTFENLILGYRITLPKDYRRSRATIVTGQVEALGNDYYTLQSEADERAQCLRDGGDVGFPQSADRDSDILVQVTRNVSAMSPLEFANQPNRRIVFTSVEPATIDGHEAARVAHQPTGDTAYYGIRANDRMYVLGPTQFSLPSRLPKGWIDDVASTFVALAPAPFPTPTATTPPRDAARQVGEALAKAFTARDVDAVVRLMPSCWVFVTPLIDGQPPGGVLYRSVVLFTQGLRDRFAAGDLTVTVDPTLQVVVQGGRERFFVRSDWREPDRTTRIDLYLEEFDGRWAWSIAQLYYLRADLINGCIPYRSPWVTGTGSC